MPAARFVSALRPPFAFDRRGATIVEFALVAPLFLLLLFGLLETSIIYFVQENLESAAEKTSRQIVIGSLANDFSDEVRLKHAACQRLPSYMQCSRLLVDFSSAPTPNRVNVNTYPIKRRIERFNAAQPGDIAVLRLYYEWPLRLSPLTVMRGFQSATGYTLIATRIVKLEDHE